MCEVVGDEVGAFEEQEYIAEAVTLQGTVQSNPVSILEGRHTRTHTRAHIRAHTRAHTRALSYASHNSQHWQCYTKPQTPPTSLMNLTLCSLKIKHSNTVFLVS